MKSIWSVMIPGVLAVSSLAGAAPAPLAAAAPGDAATNVAAPGAGGAAAPADAGAEPDRGARSRVALLAGLFTPIGELGVEYTQNLASFFEVGFAVGGGFSGAQAAVMPRLRIGSGAVGATLGAGLSGGPYRELVVFCWGEGPCMNTETTALWANVEGGLQVTSRGGFSVSLYGGLGTMLNSEGCRGPACDRLEGTQLPYGGIAIGHTL